MSKITTELMEVREDMIANNLTPAFPTHPGEVIKDEIEFRHISQRKLAEWMGMAYSVLNEILNGRRPLTERTALLFEAALGLKATPLMRLQLQYDMLTTAKDRDFMRRCEDVRKRVAEQTGHA